MFLLYQPCIPTFSKVAPSGPQWVHEIKHDGYRIIVKRIGDRVSLQTRVYEAACEMGLEGIVSKRRDMHYMAGPCKAWLKIKNPKSPAMLRVDDAAWAERWRR